MPTTTITLERSVYERLRAQRRPRESLSQTILRILDSERPSLRGLLEIFSQADADAIGKAVEDLRAEGIPVDGVRTS